MQWTVNEDYEPEDVNEPEDDGEWDESLLPAAGAALLGVPPPLALAAGRMFQRPSRAPLRRVSVGGSGVRSARIDTPRGSAQLALPSAVTTLNQFKTLEQAVNRYTERLNTTQRDVEAVTRRVDGVAADVVKSVASLRRDQRSQAVVQALATTVTQLAATAFYSRHTHEESGGGETLRPAEGKGRAKEVLPFAAALIPFATFGVQWLLTGRGRR